MLKLLILANCQATALGKICAEITGTQSEPIFEVMPCAPVFELGSEHGDYLLDQVKRCDVLLYQPHGLGQHAPAWRSSDNWKQLAPGRCISFQSLYFSGYCPELIYLKDVQGGRLNGGFCDYHDQRIVDCFLDGFPASKTRTEFQDIQLGADFIRTNAENSLLECARREEEQELDIRLSGFIREKYRQQHLFFTFNHPSNAVLIEVCRQLLGMLGIDAERIPEPKRELLSYDRFPINSETRSALSLRFDSPPDYRVQNQVFDPSGMVNRYYQVYEQHRDEVRADRTAARRSVAGKKNRRVVLHIGQSKTGTTEIQRLLHHSRDTLRQHGVIYPDVGMVSVAHFGVWHYFAGKSHDEDIGKTLRSNLSEGDCETMLLSAELFESASPKIIRSIKDEFSEFDVTIACFLRDRVSWISSMYNEIAKKAMYIDSFSSLIEGDSLHSKRFGKKLGTRKFLTPWIKHFGRRNVRVLKYERMKNVQGLFDVLEREVPDDMLQQQRVATNASLSMLTVGVLRRYYRDKCISSIGYQEATLLSGRVQKMLSDMNFDLSANSGFQNMDQVSSFIQRHVDEDIFLQQEYGIELSGLDKVAGLVFSDEDYFSAVYDEVSAMVSELHDSVRKAVA
jgi:hypothetical protein